MQALRKSVSSQALSPKTAMNAGALVEASSSDPGTQFMARPYTRDDGRGARPHPSSSVPADKFNQVDWLELSRRAFNERFFSDDWEDATEVYGE